VKLWTRHNGCAPEPAAGQLPDRDPTDGCVTRWSTGTSGRDGTEVTLYRVAGGGHTWPGGPQYAPLRLIGRVTRDFDTEAIWDFFKSHAKTVYVDLSRPR